MQTATDERGRRLVLTLVDQIAATDPGRVVYSICKTNDPADGFLDIDYATFARAVNRCSWYLDAQLGRRDNFPTLLYMGPQDLVYVILVLACNKTGFKLLLSSPRNNLEAHLSLMEKTDCGTFLLPPNYKLPIIQHILAQRKMQVVEILPLQHWLVDGPDAAYPYSKSYDEARLDPLVVLHTSGTTGLPKPIVLRHGTASPLDAFSRLAEMGEEPVWPTMSTGWRVYVSLPLFHAAGLLRTLAAAVYRNFTVVMGPSPPSADVVNSVILHGNVDESCLSPMTIVELAKTPEHLKNLASLKLICYGGGPLPQAVGDLLSTKTRLMCHIGSTETGMFPLSLQSPEDWAYLSVSPSYGVEYRHVSDGLYEQFIVRDENKKSFQGVFATFDELREWPTKDLFCKHPTKVNTWLHRGRVDDIIVYATGEKLNPIDMEQTISSNPAVRSALVTGTGKFQSSLLVEASMPPTSDAGQNELLDSIWPTIEVANKECPSHGRIHRHMITFTSLEKPMLRAGKGTVQRKATIELYQDELDALYKDKAADTTKSTVMNGVQWNLAAVEENVRATLAESSDIETRGLDSGANLFELGLDSLQVAALARRLSGLLAAHGKSGMLLPRTVYSHPTISSLTDAVIALSEGVEQLSTGETDEQKMQRLFDLHSSNLPISARQSQTHSGQLTVLLTGSTGSLGSYILNTLLEDTQVVRVYCLNRGADSALRQAKSQAAKGLTAPSDKVQMLQADASQPYLGVSIPIYRQLLNEVTTVIHNAWQVDFNLDVDSFATHIQGVRRLADFSVHSMFGARLFFISSIAAVSNYTSVTGDYGPVPEQTYESWQIPLHMGYATSKFVSERVLDTASKEAAVSAFICRVGQIAGPTFEHGVWPEQEWLPSLIASSRYLAKLPDSLGHHDTIDWIPVDTLATCIVELAKAADAHPPNKSKPGAAVFHTVNPATTDWAALLPTVAARLSASTDRPVELVSLPEWVQALRATADRTEDLARNPAVKILDFYERLAVGQGGQVLLQTKNAVGASRTLAKMGSIEGVMMENWMRQWGF